MHAEEGPSSTWFLTPMLCLPQQGALCAEEYEVDVFMQKRSWNSLPLLWADVENNVHQDCSQMRRSWRLRTWSRHRTFHHDLPQP
mmetsp:Transcript_46873/g.111577  ORF Transcript_46873/g.111577 Transcript_46873/m.111577 type:complete len:85 (+) Transcript_46873:249-503(+)